MWEKLKQLARRYDEIGELLEVPEIYADPKKLRALTREQKELSAVVETYRAYQKCEDDIVQALELVSDPELKDMAQEELNTAKAGKERLFDELRVLLLPRDPNDDKNVIVEIRGGVGGEESALFAADLYRMYAMYAEKRGYRVELLNYNDTELGGVKEADFIVSGDGAYSRFKFESGVHRVQRVPETESGGRVHTSTATVAVLPEMEEVDVDLRPEDIEMQVYRAAGAAVRDAAGSGGNVQPRRPARQQDELCRAPHPQADGHRRFVPGGALPAPEPRQVYGDAREQALRG